MPSPSAPAGRGFILLAEPLVAFPLFGLAEILTNKLRGGGEKIPLHRSEEGGTKRRRLSLRGVCGCAPLCGICGSVSVKAECLPSPRRSCAGGRPNRPWNRTKEPVFVPRGRAWFLCPPAIKTGQGEGKEVCGSSRVCVVV